MLCSVITLLVNRRLLYAVRKRLRHRRQRVPEGHWASLFAAVASSILDRLMFPARAAKPFAG